MNDKAFDISEFMKKDEPPAVEPEETPVEDAADEQPEVIEEPSDEQAEEVAVVEEPAAKETEVEPVKEESPSVEVEALKKEIADSRQEIDKLRQQIDFLKSENARLDSEKAATLEKKIDEQDRNPNALALLDREIELPDRFPGETRDHVIEVIVEARAQAEAEGRLRKAQVLEAVLMANEPNGTLAKKRAEMEKVFIDNGHIINGAVLEFLKNNGISHKNGEEYLMPAEILKRNY